MCRGSTVTEPAAPQHPVRNEPLLHLSEAMESWDFQPWTSLGATSSAQCQINFCCNSTHFRAIHWAQTWQKKSLVNHYSVIESNESNTFPVLPSYRGNQKVGIRESIFVLMCTLVHVLHFNQSPQFAAAQTRCKKSFQSRGECTHTAATFTSFCY